ncbi:MAG TPA: hypothetical protein VF630_02855, partial [Hymenobacter sp.]
RARPRYFPACDPPETALYLATVHFSGLVRSTVDAPSRAADFRKLAKKPEYNFATLLLPKHTPPPKRLLFPVFGLS